MNRNRHPTYLLMLLCFCLVLTGCIDHGPSKTLLRNDVEVSFADFYAFYALQLQGREEELLSTAAIEVTQSDPKPDSYTADIRVEATDSCQSVRVWFLVQVRYGKQSGEWIFEHCSWSLEGCDILGFPSSLLPDPNTPPQRNEDDSFTLFGDGWQEQWKFNQELLKWQQFD